MRPVSSISQGSEVDRDCSKGTLDPGKCWGKQGFGKHHHKASFPPRLPALSIPVASAPVLHFYCLLSINLWMLLRDAETQQVVQGHVHRDRSKRTALPLVLSTHAFCHITRLVFLLSPPSRCWSLEQEDTVKHCLKNLCRGTVWLYLGVFLTQRTQNIGREWRSSSIKNIILILEK